MNRDRIALVVDSCADVPRSVVEESGIFMVPITIQYHTGSFRDGVDITPEEVYRRFSEEIPKTSLPSGGEMLAVLQRVQGEGYTHALIVTISSGLSGTCQGFRMAASMVEGLTCQVLDTKSIGIGAGLIAIEGARLIRAGVPWGELVPKLQETMERTHLFFCVSTLEYLRKGGRVGLVAGTVGNLLGILPIISCNEDGVYYTVKKARGQKNALRTAIDLLVAEGERYVSCDVAVYHGGAPETAAAVLEELRSRLPKAEHWYTGQISPALGVHTGPGLVGVALQGRV